MGRPTDASRHLFQKILQESKAHDKFRGILLKTQNEKIFLEAYQVALDRGFGKALQSVEMDLNDVTNRPTADQLNDALRSFGDHTQGNGMAKE